MAHAIPHDYKHQSIVGYNNKLQTADQAMKLGVNNHVNLETKKASLRLMAGRSSKNNSPNSHPLNPIHKQATQAKGTWRKEKSTSNTDKTHRHTSHTDTDRLH